MNDLLIYHILDITTTLSQIVIFAVTANTLCKTTRTSFSKWLPPVILFFISYFWTWVIVDGTFKLSVILMVMIGMYRLCYKDSIFNIVTTAVVAILFIGAAESVTLLGARLLSLPPAITVENRIVLPVATYLISILVSLAAATLLYLSLTDFRYQMNVRDFGIILPFSFIGYLLFYIRVTLFVDVAPGFFYEVTDTVVIFVAIAFVVIFLYLKNNYYLKEQQQQAQQQIAQMQIQFAYYQNKLNDEERVRAIYHDLKNHLLVLENGQNTIETRQMAEKLRSQIADYEDYAYTGNEFLDIILKDKAEKARKRSIDFSVAVDFHGIDFIEALDISTIFGNAIDNAIEASEKLPEEQRLITIKAERVRDMVLIIVENNTAPSVENTVKEDRFLHGFGIPNIKNAVEKYDGQCRFKQNENTYLLKILIPIS